MRIQGLSVGRYGPIEDLRRGGRPGGLDVLYVRDGAGKGALVGVLRGVLFGFQDQACLSPRSEDGDPVGGRVVLADDDIEYTIERFLTEPEEVRVTRPDGVPASREDLQRLLNGIDREAFGWRIRTAAAGAQATASSDLSALCDRVLAARHSPAEDSVRAALEEIDVESESLLGADGGGRIDRLVAELHQLRERLEQARAAVATYDDLRRAAEHGSEELAQLADVLQERRARQESLRTAEAARVQNRERQLELRQSEQAAEQARQTLESVLGRQDEVRREIAKTRGRLPAKPPPALIEIEKMRHTLAELRPEISRSDRSEELEAARRRRTRSRPRRRTAAPRAMPEKPWWVFVAALLAVPVVALVLLKGGRFDSSTLLLVAALVAAATANGVVQFRAWSTQSARVRAAWRRGLLEELKAARENFNPEGPEAAWVTEARELSARLGMSTLPTAGDLDLREAELARQEEERVAWDTVQIQLSALTWSLREEQEREVALRAQLSAARDRLAACTADLLARKRSPDPPAAVGVPEAAGHDAIATAPLAVIAEQIEATEREIERVRAESRPAAHACQELEESGELTGLENQWNVSMAELELAVRRWRILAIARGLIEESVGEGSSKVCSSLLAEASRIFSTATGGRYREIVLDEPGEGLAVVEEGGRVRGVPGDLDPSTVRRLCLSLRVALVAEQARKGEALPLLLDDVLESSGDEEARGMASVLRDVSLSQQVLYFTSDPGVRDLLVNAGADRVIEL